MNRPQPHPQPQRHRASSRSFDEKRQQRPSGVFANIGHFVGQHRAATGAGIGAIVVVGIIAALFASGDDSPPIRRMQDFTILAIVPPPPPPPPPPPDQKLPEPEMIEQTPITDPQIKEEAKAEEPKDVPPDAGKDEPPPGPLGLDAAAEGPGDNFNLAGRPGGRGLLGGGGGGGVAGVITPRWCSSRLKPRCAPTRGPATVSRRFRCGSGRIRQGGSRASRLCPSPETPRSTRSSAVKSSSPFRCVSRHRPTCRCRWSHASQCEDRADATRRRVSLLYHLHR